MAEKNDKYVTFKRENGKPGEEVHDAVVIRRQDVFASPALDAYANGILVAIEAIRYSAGTMENEILKKQLANLQAKADYFHEQAELAAHASKKMPD